MKKLASVLLTLPLLASLFAFAPEARTMAASSGVTLNVYNWGEYISDGSDGSVDVNKEFTKQTGIKINYTTFSSNEELYAKLLGGGVNYDIIVPSDYMVAKLAEEGMLEKLDFSNIPNYSMIDDNFKTNCEYDPKNEYSVPYMWGMVGILYNKKLVDDVVDSWNMLWNEKYKKQIFMFDNPRDAFGIAQKLLGYSFNSTNKNEWQEACELLKKQKPLVQAYVMDQIFDKMANGEAALAPYYSGDALTIRSDNEDIAFAVPKEGTNRFVDAFCVPKGSENKAAAEKYINFMCDTDIAYANVEYIAYSSPQAAAAKMHKEYLREEYDEEAVQISYPENFENSETFANLPVETNLLLDELWVMVKIGGNDNPLMMIAVIAAFFAVWVAIVVYKRRKAKKERVME